MWYSLPQNLKDHVGPNNYWDYPCLSSTVNPDSGLWTFTPGHSKPDFTQVIFDNKPKLKRIGYPLALRQSLLQYG